MTSKIQLNQQPRWFVHNDTSSMIEALATEGWTVVSHFLNADEVAELRAQALAKYELGQFKPASVGQGANQAIHTEIRRDAVLWLDDDETGMAAAFMTWLDELRLALNQALFLSLTEAELHFALYPQGGFYRKHIDNFRGGSARLITFILYLNQSWETKDGGELRLYVNETDYVDIAPEAGTLVLFLSERFEHEVLPTTQERLSLTGWLRRRS